MPHSGVPPGRRREGGWAGRKSSAAAFPAPCPIPLSACPVTRFLLETGTGRSGAGAAAARPDSPAPAPSLVSWVRGGGESLQPSASRPADMPAVDKLLLEEALQDSPQVPAAPGPVPVPVQGQRGAARPGRTFGSALHCDVPGSPLLPTVTYL